MFFAATVAVVSTGVLAALRFDIASQSKCRLALKSFDAFLGIAGFFAGLGALLSLMPVGVGTVVVVFADRCDYVAVEFADRLSVPGA